MKKNVQRINESQLKVIVAEAVKKVLNEDILPNSTKNTPAKTAWEAISNGLVNIQQAMKIRETERVPDSRSVENGRTHVITPKDVEEIVNYIYTTIDNCLSSTLPNLRRHL